MFAATGKVGDHISVKESAIVKNLLNVTGANLPHPKPHGTGFEVIVPYIPVSLHRRGILLYGRF